MPWHPEGFGYLGFADAAGTCWDCPHGHSPHGTSDSQLQCLGYLRFPTLPKIRSIPCRSSTEGFAAHPWGCSRRARAVPTLQTGRQSLKTPVNELCFSSSSASAPPAQAALPRLPWSVCSTPQHGFPLLAGTTTPAGLCQG